MWPWGHLGVAYLLYTADSHRRFERPPLALPALALAIGSQAPDLIDKPLAWTIGILPGGRTLTHSLLFAVVFLPAWYAIASRYGRSDVGVAFAIGHLSHLVADVPPSALSGDLSGTEYLLWPLLGTPPEEPVDGLFDAVLNYYAMGPYEVLQVGLFVLGAIVWVRDGMPGLALVRSLPGRLRDRRADSP